MYFTVDETEAQRSKVIFSRLYNRLVEEPELETSFSDPVVLSFTSHGVAKSQTRLTELNWTELNEPI